MRIPRTRVTAALGALALATALAGATTPARAAVTTSPDTAFGPGAAAGAPVPFTEYNAATSPHARTNGLILGPDYRYGTLASEATGRQAVQLIGQGQYVSFRLTEPADAVDFHYAIPDSLHGGGITAPLALYVDGAPAATLSLTSEFSWLYGNYPFGNNPSVGKPDGQVPHDFYNDVRYRFNALLPAGTVVTLRVDPGDDAPWYVINTADFERVGAPVAKPAGYLDVTQSPYNVDDTGGTDRLAIPAASRPEHFSSRVRR